MDEVINKWLEQHPEASPELLAGLARVSFSTMSSVLRGYRPSEETERKLRDAMARYHSQKQAS